MTTRFYSNKAAAAALTSDVAIGATTINLDTVSGFPTSFPFTLVLEPDTVNVEVVTVTGLSGLVATVTRGQDGTTAIAHSTGSAVIHAHTAQDFKNSRDHENAASAVHGVTGAVVGTTDTQTLSNKNLTAATNVFPTSLATLTGSQALTNKDLTSGTNTFPTSLATLTGTQTLTNKDLSSGTNVFPTTLATLTGTQTLTNKTLTAPTITDPTVNGTDLAGAWTSYTPVVSNWTKGNGTITGRVKQVGKDIKFSVKFTIGSTTNTSGGDLNISLPANAQGSPFAFPIGIASLADTSTSARAIRTCLVKGDQTFVLRSPAGVDVSANEPWTWATGDTIEINGQYEGA